MMDLSLSEVYAFYLVCYETFMFPESSSKWMSQLQRPPDVVSIDVVLQATSQHSPEFDTLNKHSTGR